jgi:hypothetical protein
MVSDMMVFGDQTAGEKDGAQQPVRPAGRSERKVPRARSIDSFVPTSIDETLAQHGLIVQQQLQEHGGGRSITPAGTCTLR